MKTVIYTVTAMTALRRDANKAKLIRAKIEQMRQIQRRKPKALVGIKQGRLRVQDFRILFTATAETITVHDIGPRGGIYD